MTHYHYRRRPSLLGGLFWAFILVCSLVAIGEQAPPFGALLAVGLLAVIVFGVVAQHKQRARTATVARRLPVRRWHVVERRRGLAPCGNCGAPNKGDNFCPFCGSALTTSRETSGVSEG